jgi:hypothetical protein
MNWLYVDELKGEAVQVVKAGDALWGKSAGVEGLADDALASRG